ncbi:Cytochrome c peroxidase, mitochondrial [Choanephora cucurbitarum]|uniref:Peroxidase n=1 Tax=Choanephora cucurbitarum TaxID=101091 RepID=A0A1C7MYL6_9FUNG|nr:Cytochrome c peroxidase, mitochondrial [Choanephora cucurbitarum]
MKSLRSAKLLVTHVGRSSRPRFVTSRQFATMSQSGGSGGGFSPLLWIGCISLGGAFTYYQKQRADRIDASLIEKKGIDVDQSAQEETNQNSKEAKKLGKPAVSDAPKKSIDYQQVYNDIAELLDNDSDYDDGSYGPILLRLAWHSSGTYNADDNSGGSSGGTMRFNAEASHSANNGLEFARDLLHKHIKPKYPELSYGDLYTLGGVVAIQELGGPDIKWRPGRIDAGENKCIPEGRLPDGAKGVDHARDIFYRMGFDDQEIVALTGAHVLGRCHLDRSGFEGPWHEAPTFFNNGYFKSILGREWVKRNLPEGGWQWVDKESPDIMMLPIEITMVEDKKLRPYYELYAKDEEKFFEDFAKAFKKLIELGVPFSGEEKEYVFKRQSV